MEFKKYKWVHWLETPKKIVTSLTHFACAIKKGLLNETRYRK
jgi:hypothetical protein